MKNMNMKMIKKIIILVSFAMLTACQQKNVTEEYLMLHPTQLKKEWSQCKQSATSNCDVVKQAFYHFNLLVDDQTSDPELFGARIMKIQQTLASLKLNYDKTKMTGNQQEIAVAEKAYRDQKQQLKILYAVVALRTPE